MQHYRFYKLYPDSAIHGRDEGYHLSDWHALLYAQRISKDHAIDIWQGGRRVTTVPVRQTEPDKTASERVPLRVVTQGAR